MNDPNDREHLEQLVTCPGWLLLVAYVKSEWGSAAFARRLKHAITEAAANREDPAQAALRVNAQHDAVNALMLYPQERVQQLLGHEAARKREQDPPISRRGLL